MLKYDDAKIFVTAGLNDLGYVGSKMPLVDPGPVSVERLQSKSPGAMLFLMIGGGTGLTTEALYDRPLITVRAIGPQNDYDTAERLAYDVDSLLLGVVNNVKTIGSARVLYVTRTGGGPQLVNFDAGDRYHFQATYIAEVQR